MRIFYHGHADAGHLAQYIYLLKRDGRIDALPLRIKALSLERSPNSDLRYLVFIPVLHTSQARWGVRSNPILNLPNYVVDDVNNGLARLVIDYSNEAGTQSQMAQLTGWLVERGVFRKSCAIFFAQNRLLVATDLVEVMFFDSFIVSVARELERRLSDDVADVSKLQGSIKSAQLRDRLILCLNATPRAHRLHACAAIVRSGLMGRALVSFPSFDYGKSVGVDPDREINAMRSGAWKDYAESARLFVDGLPYVVDDFSEIGNALVNKIDFDPYVKTSVSLVTETGVSEGVVRITEKSYKALALGHIPLVYGHKSSIKCIRDFGFDVFDGLVSHEYDEYGVPLERMRAIEENLLGLDKIFSSGCKKFINEYSERALGNVEHARRGFLNDYIENILHPIVDNLSAWCYA